MKPAAMLARRGRGNSTPKKAAAARSNGRKGGRPRKVLQLLDEMDARDPISAPEREAGEKLWTEIESALTRARSRRRNTK
jgi:hypothetical protein